MPTELHTIWAGRSIRGDDHQERLAQVAEMLDDGWELVAWQPLVTPGMTSTGTCDVFLLKRFTPAVDQCPD